MNTAASIFQSDFPSIEAAVTAARREFARLTVGADDDAFPIRVEVMSDGGKRLAIVSSDPDEDCVP